MHESSGSIASLAAALAKAQAELVNPEKTQVGILESDKPSGGRSFRYAPLSSGLEIVRKTLSQQGIAALQTTAVDQTTGTITLTTVLAHASGEWIASHWPICSIEAVATPHRMGAALTYARRYALFTLVGIAGEDDLDAPDLAAPESMPDLKTPKLNGASDRQGSARPRVERPRSGGATASAETTSTSVLKLDESQTLCDQLLKELDELNSQEDISAWAYNTMPAKNRLAANHGQMLEDAFQVRMALVSDEHKETTGGSSAAEGIDKSALAIPEPRRVRDRDHVKFVAAQACLICGRQPADAHHLRFAQTRALGRKVSDEFTVPLCRGHHRAVHRADDENNWWKEVAIDPMRIARKLWRRSRPVKRRFAAATPAPIIPLPFDT
jgi:hypothetical protein